jgi:hypothetical protein
MNFKGIVCENMDWIKLDQMKFSGVLTWTSNEHSVS